MDLTGVGLAAGVAVVAGVLLFWHIQAVKRRPAMGHDKLMGALWAAMLVLALARVVFLVATGGGAKPAEPAPNQPPAPAQMPK